jgi:CDP-diacylglycerol---glycerol-3-phosphate 3-phosphatidyltransferase
MRPRADVQTIGETASASRLFRDLRSVPNLLSLSRIALIYLAAALFLLGHPFWAMGIGILAGVTDYFDGYIARRTGQVTQLGAILDRLSDLIFETTWLVLATFFHLLPPVFLLLYLLRELVVLSARLYCGERGVALRSSFVGKLKTNFFGYSAILVFVPIAESLAPYHRALSLVGFLGVSIGLALSYWSAFGYLKTFARAYDDGE